MTSVMTETMASQAGELGRLLADPAGVDAAADRLRGRRLFLVGTGTSWHAANIGAWFLRAAGVDACPVMAMDAALYGPRPTSEDGLILLSHRGTKLYTTEALERARADGAPTVVISGIGSPGADIETTAQERSSAYTASHTGAMLRLAQIAVALGADLGPLDAVPDAVAAVIDGPPIGVEPPRAVAGVHRCRAEPVDGGRRRPQGARDRLRRDVGDERRAVPARPGGRPWGRRYARLPERRRPGRGAAARGRPLGRVVPGHRARRSPSTSRASSCRSSH